MKTCEKPHRSDRREVLTLQTQSERGGAASGINSSTTSESHLLKKQVRPRSLVTGTSEKPARTYTTKHGTEATTGTGGGGTGGGTSTGGGGGTSTASTNAGQGNRCGGESGSGQQPAALGLGDEQGAHLAQIGQDEADLNA